MDASRARFRDACIARTSPLSGFNPTLTTGRLPRSIPLPLSGFFPPSVPGCTRLLPAALCPILSREMGLIGMASAGYRWPERDAGENRPASSPGSAGMRTGSRDGQGGAVEALGETERMALDTLAIQVGRLREEVHRMAKELDALLVWERSCPMCGRGLRRESVSDLARCACGWVWE